MADVYGFHPFADLFPTLDEKALAELAQDIRDQSQREPIFLWQGKIIDGRNRYRACKLAGIEPVFKHIEFPGGEAEALAYVVSKNLKRRHLFFQQRVEIAGKIANMRQGERTDVQPSAPVPKVSQAEAAKMLDVSERSVRNAKAVIDLSPELWDDVRAGKMGLREAADIARHGPTPQSEPPVDPDAEPESGSSEPVTPTESEPPEAQLARLSANAKAQTAKAMKADARYRRKEVGEAFRALKEAERSRFLAEVIGVDDVVAWRMGALDSQRRQIADAYFNAIASVSERLKHDEVVRAWIAQHEGHAVEG